MLRFINYSLKKTMTNRDRSSGWQHAKISGHLNEDSIFDLINVNDQIKERLLNCSGYTHTRLLKAYSDGIHGKKVDSVFNLKTTPKTDIKVQVKDKYVNISLKKSRGGQVFLISVDRFIEGFEIQYNKLIPNEVKYAISLYWGSHPDVHSIVRNVNSEFINYELRKHRLVASTLKKYDSNLYHILINWFAENASEIFDFCFSKGLAKYEEDWADIIWYKNQFEENDIDAMFNINEILAKIPNEAEFGKTNGGSTIQLPFGFVQWHSPTKRIPGLMQFHHSFDKLIELCNFY